MATKQALQPEDRATTIEAIACKTLSGDIRDFLLNQLRASQDKRPWTERNEAEQRQTITAADNLANSLVRRIVGLVGTGGFPAIGGTLDSVTMKGTMKAVVLLPAGDPNRHALADSQGGQVTVVMMDVQPFLAQRADWKASKDQPPLAPELDFDEEEVFWIFDANGAEAEHNHQSTGEALRASKVEALTPVAMTSNKWGEVRWVLWCPSEEKENPIEAFSAGDWVHIFSTKARADHFVRKYHAKAPLTEADATH